MRRIPARIAVLATSVLMGVVGSVVNASPALAVVDDKCATASVGATCYQYEILRRQIGVPLSGESKVFRVLPGASPVGPTVSANITATSSYKITNAVSQTAAFSWSFGSSREFGAIANLVAGSASAGIKIDGNVSASGSTSVTRTSETSIGWSTTYSVSHPPVDVRRGYDIYTHVLGNKYEVNQRACEKKLWGTYCYEWQTMFIDEPTGLGVREQPLGWGSTAFGAGGRAVWTTNVDPRYVGQGVCPFPIGLNIDLARNTYQFSCYLTILAQGNVQVSNIRENWIFDLDSADVTLTSGPARGVVQLTRSPWVKGNPRSVTMNSSTGIDFVGTGKFALTGWHS
ncbi:hypothetical protein ACTMSW_25430 [Micromonospora sp. BQ11]|uniref:hypothetical protein n=1 Tax=Micromonospora sp. BQ11 TaxID=3452212 RepID=UPI003F89FCE9